LFIEFYGCFCIVQAISARWKLPVLIFQTCNNYAGYTCIQLIDEAYPATTRNSCSKKNDSSPLTPFRRIIPLHIRGEFFNYLESSDVMLDNQNNSFNSKLRDIFMEMRSLFDLENQIIADQIVTKNTSNASVGGASDVSSSSDLTSCSDKIHIANEVGRRLFGGSDEKKITYTNIDNDENDDNEDDEIKKDDDDDDENDDDEDDENEEEDDDDDENDDDDDNESDQKGERDNITKSSTSSSGEEDDGDEESGMQGGNSISSNSFSKSHENCNYDTVMFPEDCLMREHTFGDEECNKKYYFNILR